MKTEREVSAFTLGLIEGLLGAALFMLGLGSHGVWRGVFFTLAVMLALFAYLSILTADTKNKKKE